MIQNTNETVFTVRASLGTRYCATSSSEPNVPLRHPDPKPQTDQALSALLVIISDH